MNVLGSIPHNNQKAGRSNPVCVHNEEIIKMLDIYTMECYSAIKKSKLLISVLEL